MDKKTANIVQVAVTAKKQPVFPDRTQQGKEAQAYDAEQARLAKQKADEAAAAKAEADRRAAQVASAVVMGPSIQANVSQSSSSIMAAAGISPSDYQYVDYIVSHESGWRTTAQNPSGAYGLCQSLPAGKMASAGGDYLSNPVTQMVWCNSYAQSRYGGWANAYTAWTQKHWW